MSTVGVSASYVMMCVMFGLFMERSGTGQLFMDFAMSITGHTAGGPGIGFPVVTFRIIAELNIEGAPAESATDIAPWRDAALSEEEQ